MSQGIYRITNLVNGHEYIGQSINIERRWRKHISISNNKKDKNYNLYLYSSMRKYGLENFKFEIIELVPNKETLLKKEQYYYELSNHIFNNVYPQYRPKLTRKTPVYKIDMKTLEIIKRYDTITEASKDSDTSSSNISTCCLRKTSHANGYHWCYEKDYTKDWKPAQKNKKICTIDIDNIEKIKVYDSIKDVFGNNKKINLNIYRAIFSRYKQFYVCLEENLEKTIKILKGKEVLQLDENGVLIEKHSSMASASKKTKISASSISRACNGKLKKAGGFIWKLANIY